MRRSGGPQDLAKGGYNRGSGGVAPSRQQIFAVFTKKSLILAHFFIEKGRAVSAVTINQCGPRLRALRAV